MLCARNRWVKICVYVSLLVPVCHGMFICMYDNKSKYKQKPCHPSQTFSKFDALLQKTLNKVLLVPRYQGLTSLGP